MGSSTSRECTAAEQSRRSLLLANPFIRKKVAPGLDAWRYEFRNREPLEVVPLISSAFEITVQLRETWEQSGLSVGRRVCTPSSTVVIPPGEWHSYAFRASHDAGLQVGFHLYPEERPELAPFAGRLRLVRPTLVRDARWVELAQELLRCFEMGTPISSDEVSREVVRLIVDLCDVAPDEDDLLRGARELDESYAAPLYLSHVASAANMHPETFARRFRRRFGISPVRYRIERRLNAAVRLLWSEPEKPVHEVARQVGFDDLPYFHRAFLRKFRLTPAQAGRRPGAGA